MKMKSITSWLVAAATATVMVGCASTDTRGHISDTHPDSIGGTEVTAAELHDDLQSAKQGTTAGGPGTHFGPNGETLVTTTTSTTADVTMTTTPDQPLVEREVVVEREIVTVPAEPRTEVVIIEREPVDVRAELDVDDDDDDDEEVTTTRTMLRKD